MKYFLVGVFIPIAFSGAVYAASGDWKPKLSAIAALEATIKIPGDGSQRPIPLSHYARYYTGVIINGHRVIRGEFVIPFPNAGQRPGIHIVSGLNDFPSVMDGGCTVINLDYDADTASLIAISCNGVA